MRRILVAAVIAAGLAGVAAPSTAGYWACAALDESSVSVGVCLRDPVPDPLPRVPDVPSTPEY